MEQDHLLGRHQPLTRPTRQDAILLAAHGERHAEAGNHRVAHIAAALAARGIAPEIGYGFLNGMPSIPAALAAIAADTVSVYPLFLADGYFGRQRLRELLHTAGTPRLRQIRMLSPLGLDPALAPLVAAKAEAAAKARGIMPDQATLILLAHGSHRGAASQTATENLARQLAACARFREVKCAYLEQEPSLAEACADAAGPLIIAGLFMSEGLHGGGDVPRVIAALGRHDPIFIGNLGTWPEVADVVAAALMRVEAGGAKSDQVSTLDPIGALR
ncbi:MAG: hypothetical protein IT539_11740 [Bradyrhizobiaceae bacterium]|nr:hypothetical protein [Bradyrhizobiaceae bacterium]